MKGVNLEAAPIERRMTMVETIPLAAIGFSLLYLFLGGGIGGAIVIFIIARLLGR